ncbi:MAG: TolC family protein [Alphaproteobacteria bacterium]|nr:TolC family protein [Alphaproteobacteria bacterium]MBT5917286.1 TolC family protein [Alphaproteobacteria bacterium]MBT6387587.1 TolC family protein [Alphaproteobacteria bacterium]
MRGLRNCLSVIAVSLMVLPSAPVAALSMPTPQELIQMLASSPLLARDVASRDIAAARLDQALAALKPRLTGRLDGKRFSSMRAVETRNSDILGSLEIVQPVYDFGRSRGGIDAARAEIMAQAFDQQITLSRLVLEGMALYYELHASDLEVQALQEENTIAFFRAVRLEEKDVVGDANPIELMEARAESGTARYVYSKAKSSNLGIRLRLEELTGKSFTETTLTPDVPEDEVFEVDLQKMVELVQKAHPLAQSLRAKRDAMQARANASGLFPKLEAYGRVNESTRNLRGRDEWALGARLVVPFYDGGVKSSEEAQWLAKRRQLDADIAAINRSLVRQTHLANLARQDARMRLTAARFAYKAGRQRLLLEQLQRSQDREASVGGATTRIGHIETELVRALGAYRIAGLQLAVLLGRPLNQSFAINFLEDLKIADQ